MNKSLQFIPGNRPRMLDKAYCSKADVLIFDLEDSIPVHEKESARYFLTDFLNQFDGLGKDIVVRINSEESLWQKDIESTLAAQTVNGYMIPKATSDFLKQIDRFLNGFRHSSIFLIPMIESAKGLLNAYNIACTSSRTIGMLFGAEDFTMDMGINRTKESHEIDFARSLFAITCHAAGVEAFDTPYTDIHDFKGLASDTLIGKNLGMTGRSAIHPDQVDIINNIFRPSEQELAKARKIIECNKEAEMQGTGSFSMDGEMIDLPVVLRAKKLLSQYNI